MKANGSFVALGVLLVVVVIVAVVAVVAAEVPTAGLLSVVMVAETAAGVVTPKAKAVAVVEVVVTEPFVVTVAIVVLIAGVSVFFSIAIDEGFTIRMTSILTFFLCMDSMKSVASMVASSLVSSSNI